MFDTSIRKQYETLFFADVRKKERKKESFTAPLAVVLINL